MLSVVNTAKKPVPVRVLIIPDPAEIQRHIDTVLQSADQSLANIRDALTGENRGSVFYKVKFEQIGVDPLCPKRLLNFIEQVNQSFTYLASFRAAQILMKRHPLLRPLTLNLGTSAGSDIVSADGELAAEVFASVRLKNNGKLKKDIQKVTETPASLKYVFFMCPDYAEGRQKQLERAGVIVWALPC